MNEEIFTQEEKDELLALRKEKKALELIKLAEKQLEKYGAPRDFAQFLVRETDEETENAVKNFSESFGKAKLTFIQNNSAPRDETVSRTVKRGVRRV